MAMARLLAEVVPFGVSTIVYAIADFARELKAASCLRLNDMSSNNL